MPLPTSEIDWDAAVRVGRRLAPTGPVASASEARQVVADLHRFATVAERQVRETTGLGLDLPIDDAVVVDRPKWVAAAALGMQHLMQPLADRMLGSAGDSGAAGAGVGALLGLMSSRVLGQYDPVGNGGTLLLVAPNVLKVEREIDAVPEDFRLWVCLHESTHRLQFSAVPWMVDYFTSLVDEYAAVAPTETSALLGHIRSVVRSGGWRSGGAHAHGNSPAHDDVPRDALSDSLLRRIQTPEQQQVFDKIMALMTLLEGHADYIMDAVGPVVIPSVHQIRDSFTERRNKGRGPLDKLLRSLLGMDAKMAQYARGAAFVDAVVGRVGMARFNAVFDRAENLPTMSEIQDPEGWVRRVHGATG